MHTHRKIPASTKAAVSVASATKSGNAFVTVEVSPMLTRAKILREMELLDWGGHVELPVFDMEWLASQLYTRLNATDVEICEVCHKPAPIVIPTKLGPMCASCIEDLNDHVEQIKELMDE